MSFRVARIQDIGEGSDIDVCAHGAIRAVNGFAVPIAINAVEAIDEQTPSVVDVNMERSDADALDLEDIVGRYSDLENYVNLDDINCN